MTVPLGELEIAIYQRLEPLLDSLNEAEIPLILLPKYAGAYNEVEHGMISIVIPNVTSLEAFDIQKGSQLVQLDCLISLSLPTRYHDDPNQRSTLEYCSKKIIGLLLGYKPLVKGVRNPFQLNTYTLLIPESNYWEATIVFTIKVDICSNVQDIDVIAEELAGITLHAANQNLDADSAVKVKEYNFIRPAKFNG